MFLHRVDPNERQKVLDLLGGWSRAITKIDKATNAMKLTMAEQPLGMKSEEFERARKVAVAVLGEVQEETSAHHFWPVLADKEGTKIILAFRVKLEECHQNQLMQLRLLGAAAEAFRRGKDDEAPSVKEMKSSNKAFAEALDEMGAIGGKLARHYQISAQEYQREI